VGDQSRPAESHDPRIDAALRDYLERVDSGETLDTASFVAKHAEIADELRSLIDAEIQLRRLASGNAEGRPDTSTRSFALHGQETIAPQSRAPGEESRLKEHFGRYRIVKVLGQGAMGTVYLAEDTQLKRQVALKTPHFEQDPTGELLERLYREARAAATLRHPNICPVHDVGEIEGTHYISMAYIEGHPLSAFIRANKPQPERQILIVVRKLALALQEAHDHKIVHRDLKPANIMVDKRGEPLIMDFGLARHSRPDEEVRLTHSGTLVGTPAYMAPEQVDADPEKIGPLTDEYSLGVILYELLTAQLPFRGSMMAVLGQIVTKDATPPSQLRPGLDPRIEAACLKMMAKNPADRFQSLSAVAEELATILKNPAARPASTSKSAAALTLPASGERPAASGAGTSQIVKSQKEKSLTGSDLVSLEELARKCWARHDYDQVVQIAERIPEEKRNAALQKLFEQARLKTDEIAYLLLDIDEAERVEDGQTALKKAEALLKIKPGHHRALEVQQRFGGEGDGGIVRVGRETLTNVWREGGWIPWSALAFGLAIVGVMSGLIIIWLGRTVIVIDAQVPGIKVEVIGQQAIITVPGKQPIKVEPGNVDLKISYEGLETLSKSFTLKKGETKVLSVGIANAELVARFENEIPGSVAGADKNNLAEKGKGAETKKAAPTGPRPPLLAAPFVESTAQQARHKWADYLQEPGELTNTVGMKLLLVPPGEFLMGTAEDRYGAPPEKPQHEVRITHPFYLAAHEVTRGEFAKFVSATGYKTEAERDGGRAGAFDSKGDLHEVPDATWKNPGFEQSDSHPVVIVSWNDATAFCRWLSEQEGQIYRLPTEAEWEYACRAGTTTAYSSGGALEDLFAVGNALGEEFREHFHLQPKNADDKRPQDGYVFTAPVGSFRPNQFGLFDMHGNAWEWCQDWFSPTYYAGSTTTDPTGPPQGSKRVSRGGGFDCGLSARSATRDSNEPTMRAANLGFRVVRATGDAGSETTPTPPVATTAPVVSADGFVALFNGQDLSGWKPHPSQRGNWRVENGILIGSGTVKGQPYISERSHLYTERGDFKDFHLRVEARINDGGNSGLYFRSTFGPIRPPDQPKFPYGYEAQIDSSVDRNRTGSLYAGGGVVVGIAETLVPPGQWFTEEVIAQGNHIVVKVNGQTAAVYRDQKQISASGYIALQQNNRQTVAEFRKIEIKELSSGAQPEASGASADGYMPLFNGKDLSGWSADPNQQGAWHVEKGLLVGGGPAGASLLYSDRTDYQNFRLRIEARLKDNEYSGLWVRTQMPPPIAANKTPTTGYKVELREPADRRLPRTGSIWASGRREDGGSSYSGFARNDPMVQPGQWFTLEVVAEGKRVYVLVNGQQASETNWFKKDQYSSGRIALQQHVGKPSIEFRKIEIKELAAAPVAGGSKTAALPMDKDALIAPFEETDAKSAQQKWANRLGKTVGWTNTIQMQFQLIPPGQFMMGKGQSGHDGPAHTVRITRPFYIGTYEVTRGQFATFVAANHQFKSQAERSKGGFHLDDIEKRTKWDGKHQYTWKKPGFLQDNSHPVVDVTWDDAREFCNWLSRKEGKTYRLPTEAEWEYAARAGTTAGHYGGDRAEDLTQIANYPDASTKSKFPKWRSLDTSDGFLYTSPVGQFRPNNFGLYDTLGNVLEWCSDWSSDDYYTTSPLNDPPGPAAGRTRAGRGGSFVSLSDVSGRWSFNQDHHVPDLGFRVVCEIPTAPAITEPSSAAVSPPAADNRHAWLGADSRFDNFAAGKWRETFPKQPGHAIYFFDEVTRTPDSIELIDRTRIKSKGGVSVRLTDNQALMRWGGPGVSFNPLQPGEWQTEAEATAASAPPAGNRKSIFNGTDLAGWRGLPGFWHVKDRAIVGSVPANKPKAQTFLCSKREYKDFELRFRARLLGGVGNSGVQFRSKIRDPKILSMVGPQCEIVAKDGKRKYPASSLLTEPSGEPSVGAPAGTVDRIFKAADFNDFEIRCVGRHVRIKLNGETTVDADFPSMPDAGLIGWQMHKGNPPREVTFRDIEFTDLSAAPVPTDAAASIPESAVDRQAAELVLSLGGTVGILQGPNLQRLESGGHLPVQPFRVMQIRLVDRPNVTDATLASFRDLSELVELNLTKSNQITDRGLDAIQELPALKSLHLSETQVDDAGLSQLKHLPQLEYLSLGKTKITDAGLANLRELTKLQTLWLSDTGVSDAGLAHLSGLSLLEQINLRGSKVTDSGLSHLQGLKKLKVLDLQRTQVTKAGADNLDKILRSCRILITSETN
jgi:formylglycine-generating enzyme required for sulfatase activity/serine/threonine protein kinase